MSDNVSLTIEVKVKRIWFGVFCGILFYPLHILSKRHWAFGEVYERILIKAMGLEVISK